jgi:uncharacterized glyoxalase superfamily protein PhnB
MAQAKPVPDGFRTVTPHMIIRNASTAIEFYKKAFNAEEVMRLPGPDGTSVMHAEIRVGNSIIMIVDELKEWGLQGPETLGDTPVSIHLYVDDADAWFERATKAGAEAIMPVQDTFWGDRYGKVKDPFGHQWSIATHVEDLAPEQINERMAEQFAKGC